MQQLVHEFYTIKKKTIANSRIFERRILKRIEFTRSEKCACNPERTGVSLEKNGNRISLIEQSDIREQMINYLQAVKKYRDESRPIIYMDETCLLYTSRCV